MNSERKSESTSQLTGKETAPSPLATGSSSANQVIQLISPWVEKLGFTIVYVELLVHRQKVLRLFIDFLDPSEQNKGIGIEDCVRVARTLDEPLDQMPEIDAIFKGTYELEVSSPGVDRPLRTERDFERFSGRDVRIHVFRPLNPEELGNPEHHDKNPRQKNFLGKLVGLRRDSGSPKVVLSLNETEKKPGKKKASTRVSPKSAKPGGVLTTNSAAEVTIPLPLISKANLEPSFEVH